MDNSFDGDGIAAINYGSGTISQIQDIALQPDGKIVAAGYNGPAFPTINYDFAVARFNSDGTPDNSFDTDGKTTTAIGSGKDQGIEMALQADGKLTTSFGSDNDGARAVAVQPDGKIIAAGYGHNGTNADFALIRYLANGTPDPSFGTAGKVTTNITTLSEQINALVLQADGKIIAVGSAQGDFVLVRYLPDGTPDPGFGTGGIVLTAIGSSTDEAMAVTIQPDGYILVAGNSFTGGSSAFAVVRYKPDGNVDTDFGVNGKVTAMPGITTNSVTSISLQNDLKILVAGTAYTGTNTDIAVVRYLPDGTPDIGFNGDGVAVIDVLGLNDVAGAMKLNGNRIFIASTAFSHQLEDFMLLSLQNDASALPLSLQRFRAQLQQQDVLLQWRTATEQNTAIFYIERSQDGKVFQSIGNVAAAGTSTAVKDYSFTDTDPLTGTAYYRLKMVDMDGRFTYSAVIIVRMHNNGLTALQLSPNPAQNILQVQLATTNNDKVSLQIVDAAGRVVKTEQYTTMGNSLAVSIDITGLPAGHYTLVASSKRGRETRQFIKNQ